MVSRPSIHASGIVVCDIKLQQIAPLHVTASSKSDDNNFNNICTQFSMEDLEYLGLVKIDNLALNTLTVIDKTLKLISETHKTQNVSLNNINLNDPKILRMLANGNTKGVFQFESYGMQKMLKNIQPNSIDDLIAAVALFRPGCLKEGIPDEYARRKNNITQVVTSHPLVGECLKKTFGLPIYQEDVMKLSRVLAGFDESEADTLRKAMGKKKSEIFEKMQQKWIEGCRKNNIPEDVINNVWQSIVGFAGYSFNKSHAAAYAILAYHTAALKVYFKREYMICLVNVEAIDRNYEDVESYLSEMKNIGIEMYGANINYSDAYCVPEKEGVRIGLCCLKGVSTKTADVISKNKPYTSLFDFCKKVPQNVANKSVMEFLAANGALDDLGDREDILNKLESVRNELARQEKSGTNGLLPSTESDIMITGTKKNVDKKKILKNARRIKNSSEPESKGIE